MTIEDEIAGALKHTMSKDEAGASVSKPKTPLDRHTFDRALLAFMTQVEAKANFFLSAHIEMDGNEFGRFDRGGYSKPLSQIFRYSQSLRQVILMHGKYMTDEERARLLDASSLDDLLKQDE